MRIGIKTNQFLFFLAGMIVFSILLAPQISISLKLPAFQIVDFLMPIVGITLFTHKAKLNWNRYLFILVAFGFVILVSIAINNRLDQHRDYFEIYKLLKFTLIILLFSLVSYIDFVKFIAKPVFVILVFVNLFHFFNLFNINKLISDHYNGGIHIQTFGLNSLGLPDTKRMLGFSGNPNINSIVFAFFSVIFYPKNNQKLKFHGWFFIALVMIFLCQSRTNLLAILGVIVITFLLTIKENKQAKINVTITVLIAYLLSYLLAKNTYLNTLFDPSIIQTGSLLGRIEIWQFLWEMIKEKPILGYSPFKEFFYDNSLYPESEYILQTWRYGFVGLAVFLSVLFYPAYAVSTKLFNPSSKALLQFTFFMGINSFTNNPFSDRTILVLYAATIGLSLNIKKRKENAA